MRYLEEIQEVLATLEPVNEYEYLYRDTLKKLWKNMHLNYHHHGIIPERQQLPRLKTVRLGLPYLLYVPPEK